MFVQWTLQWRDFVAWRCGSEMVSFPSALEILTEFFALSTRKPANMLRSPGTYVRRTSTITKLQITTRLSSVRNTCGELLISASVHVWFTCNVPMSQFPKREAGISLSRFSFPPVFSVNIKPRSVWYSVTYAFDVERSSSNAAVMPRNKLHKRPTSRSFFYLFESIRHLSYTDSTTEAKIVQPMFSYIVYHKVERRCVDYPWAWMYICVVCWMLLPRHAIFQKIGKRKM